MPTSGYLSQSLRRPLPTKDAGNSEQSPTPPAT